MDFQCAIFDLDGTLLDSMPVWDHLAEHYLLQKGKAPRHDLRATLAAMDMRESADYLISAYSLPVTPDGLMDEMNALAMEAYRTTVQPKPGVPEYLAALRERGVRLSVATATDRPPVEAAAPPVAVGLLRRHLHLHRGGQEQAPPRRVPRRAARDGRQPGRRRGV